jgi:hypothetical protein
MDTTSRMPSLDLWTAALPARLRSAVEDVHRARSCAREYSGEVFLVLGAVEDALATVVADSGRVKPRPEQLEWLHWVMRLAGVLEQMVGFCVAVRCSKTEVSDDDLERVAIVLGELGREARLWSDTLTSASLRGAA